jgi:hypothetical protein
MEVKMPMKNERCTKITNYLDAWEKENDSNQV